MHVSQGKIVVSLMLVGLFLESTIPVFASADDNGKGEPSAKRVAAKVDAPAPLTERERWLLDRVEELEKRVADLESKGKTSESPDTDASAAQPGAVNAPTSVAGAVTPSIAPGAISANPESPSND